MTISDWFKVLSILEDYVQLSDTFKCEILQAVKECNGVCLRSRDGCVSGETVAIIEEIRASRLADDQDQNKIVP